MRRGRGLRWTASSASMSLDLRVVSAVATPRCAPIFSNPASNLSGDHLGGAELVAVVDAHQVVGLAPADAEQSLDGGAVDHRHIHVGEALAISSSLACHGPGGHGNTVPRPNIGYCADG